MKVVPLDAKFFAGLLVASAEFSSELFFAAGPEGFECFLFDDAKVSMVAWRVGPQYFSELPAELVEFQLLREVGDAVRGVKPGDALALFVAVDKVGVVVDRGTVKSRRSVARRELESSMRKLPRNLVELREKAEVRSAFSGEALSAVLAEFKGFDGSVAVQAVPEALIFSQAEEGGRSLDVRVAPVGKGELIEGAGVGKYSVEYFAAVGAFLKPFSLVELRFTPTFPLFLSGEMLGASVVGVIAPIVENR